MADAVDRDALILKALHMQTEFNELIVQLEDAGCQVAVVDPPGISAQGMHPAVHRVCLTIRVQPAGPNPQPPLYQVMDWYAPR